MIPEAMITRHLNMLLHDSEPGAEMQYLHVISTPNDATSGPFGIPEESKLEVVIAAIVPDAPTAHEPGLANAQRLCGAHRHRPRLGRLRLHRIRHVKQGGSTRTVATPGGGGSRMKWQPVLCRVGLHRWSPWTSMGMPLGCVQKALQTVHCTAGGYIVTDFDDYSA